MTFIAQPKTEWEKKDCPSCGKKIVSRLKEYKDFPSKIQWQNEKETKAHYDKDGNCNGDGHAVTLETSTVIDDIIATKPSIELLDESTKKLIKNEAILLFHVRKTVESTIKEYDVDPHGGMIWEMTALIWKKYFGGKE